VILLAYPAVSLWPYEPGLPEHRANGAETRPGGGLRFPSPGLARTPGPAPWLEAAQAAGALELSLRLASARTLQPWPARIVALSLNRYNRNLSIDQDVTDLVVRVRTADDRRSGRNYRVPDVFREPAPVDLDLRIEPGRLEITLDGALVVERSLPLVPLDAWEPGYPLALGNEVTGEYPWEGEIESATLRAGDTSVDLLAPGVLERPARYWRFETWPKLVPLRDSSPIDIALNVLMYVPLGVLLGRRSRGRGARAGLRAWATLFAVSLGLELLQLAVPVRCASVDDLLFNTLGGGCGVVLGRLGGRAPRPA
jgi:hypothetical protein